MEVSIILQSEAGEPGTQLTVEDALAVSNLAMAKEISSQSSLTSGNGSIHGSIASLNINNNRASPSPVTKSTTQRVSRLIMPLFD